MGGKNRKGKKRSVLSTGEGDPEKEPAFANARETGLGWQGGGARISSEETKIIAAE